LPRLAGGLKWRLETLAGILDRFSQYAAALALGEFFLLPHNRLCPHTLSSERVQAANCVGFSLGTDTIWG